MTLRIVALPVLALLSVPVSSCVVYPDPYRMHVFCPVDGPGEWVSPPYPTESHGQYLVGGDYVRVWILDASPTIGEAFPPYRLVIEVHSDAASIQSITFSELVIRKNGAPITEFELTHRRSRRSVSLPVTYEMSELYAGRPGDSRVALLTNEVVLEHAVGDRLSVDLDVIVEKSGVEYGRTVRWAFEGRIHKGIFRYDGYIRDECR